MGAARKRGGSGLVAPLRHRDFRLLLTAFAISCAGSWAYNVALAVFVYEQTNSAAWVGAATIGRFIPSLLFGAYGGVLADRFERVRLMAGLDWLSTFWMGMLTVVAAVHGPVLLAIALAGLASLTEIVYEPAVAAITPQTVPLTSLAAANTLRNTVDNVAIVAGPAIGAVLILLGSPPLAFAANAGSFALSAVVVSRMAVRSKPVDVTDAGTAGPLRQMLVGVRAIASSATATILVLYSLIASFVYGVDTVQFVVLSEEQLHTGASGYGYLLAGLGTGGVAAAGLVNRLASWPRLGPVILIGMAVYCLPTLLFLVIDNPAAAFVIECVRGAGTLMVDVLAVTALQRSLPSELQARVFGAFYTGVLLAISLGALLTPIVITHWGLDTSLWLVGGALPALCLLGWPWLRRMDQRNVAHLAELEPRVLALRGLGIFAEASRPVLERLATTSVETRMPAGSVMIREGDVADAFYALLDGQMSVRSVGEGSAEVTLPSMGEGAYFGEIGLLERMPRTATVTAAQDSTVLQISGEDFLAALSDTPASAALLEGARGRLARTHPTVRPAVITPGSTAPPVTTDLERTPGEQNPGT